MLYTLSVTIAAMLVLFAVASAQGPGVTYKLIATIPVPADDNGKGLSSFDITWVDPGTQRFYLTNRTTVKGGGRIDVIDTQANKFLYSIPGMVGAVPGLGKAGPNGVVAIPQLNQLYVGDGDSTVKVIDLAMKKVIATINTGGTARADELGYDPLDHVIMIANASDSPPFVTFISADTQTVLGTYTYPMSQTGLEQPVWNKVTERLYMTVPASSSNPGGSVDVFNATTLKREGSFPLFNGCSPAGLVLTPSQHLMTSCGVLVNAQGGILSSSLVGAVGGDQIWYNPGDNRIYFGSTVVDADTGQLIAKLPTAGARNPAVDSETNHVFVPIAGVGVKVFAADIPATQ
jgi:YVTN family beta-propeller protein